MAAEYEVNEIGYIGSIWGGTFGIPKIVGRTIQVANVPNTIESGGYVPSAVYFTNKDDIDLNVFNNQLPLFPDGKRMYGIKKLKIRELQEIVNASKVSIDYLSGLNVVCYLNSRGNSDLIPIQSTDSWGSFNTTSNTTATYIFSNDAKYLTKYVFLVSEEDLNLLKTYFLTIQSQETIFDPSVVANPTDYLLSLKAPPPIVPQNKIDFRVINFNGSNPTTFNDKIINVIANVPFEKMPYYNDVHEDMQDSVAEENASDQFIVLLKNSSELFYISNSEGDDEYNRLSSMISSSIDKLEKKYVGGNLTGGITPVNESVTVSDDGSVIIGGGLTGGVTPVNANVIYD
jgi:hypothetical protein